MTVPHRAGDVVPGAPGRQAVTEAPRSDPTGDAVSDGAALGGTKGQAALVVSQLTKRFGERTAFSDVTFEVAHGEVFGFLGPNGAGKTTTVRTLGTLIAPTSGSATVAGIPLRPENGVEIRQHIGIMPEAPGLYLRLTVTENLEYFAGLYGLHQAGTRIKEALDAVNLGDRAGDLCGGLSKGLRQRVGLVRTLLSDPAIMFLDEPTSGLDPVAALEVHNLIIGLRKKGVTIFLTTHRLEEAEKLCDRVAILNTTLRTVGTPDALRAGDDRQLSPVGCGRAAGDRCDQSDIESRHHLCSRSARDRSAGVAHRLPDVRPGAPRDRFQSRSTLIDPPVPNPLGPAWSSSAGHTWPAGPVLHGDLDPLQGSHSRHCVASFPPRSPTPTRKDDAA